MSNKICWDAASKVYTDSGRVIPQSDLAQCPVVDSPDHSSKFICCDNNYLQQILNRNQSDKMMGSVLAMCWLSIPGAILSIRTIEALQCDPWRLKFGWGGASVLFLAAGACCLYAIDRYYG